MNYFFDTPSLVKIYHIEEGSEKVLEIYKSKHVIDISDLSKIELTSTVYRKYRGKEINLETLNAIKHKFQYDIENRYKILRYSSLISDEALTLIRDFAKERSLRTLDSLQFAFFKIYCEKDDIFVCSDKKFINIVKLEGINTLFP